MEVQQLEKLQAPGADWPHPGVVAIKDWRPDSVPDINSTPTAMWGGVGRKS